MKNKTIRETIIYGIDKLKNASVASPKLDSEVFLSLLLEKDRLYLFTNHLEEVDSDVFKDFEDMIDLRAQGIPLAYIVNQQEFMSLDFYVDENVLIPRADTEILVEEVIGVGRDIENVSILDLGCGSGAISVSLAYYLKSSSVIAIDISEVAVAITSANAKRNGVANKMTFINSDMFDIPAMKVDILVSNPPYIPSTDISDLQIEVSTYEPKLALDGGLDGLDFYRKIIDIAPDFVNDGGFIFLEIGYDQGIALVDLMEAKGCYENVEIVKDLAGLDRVVKAVVRNSDK